VKNNTLIVVFYDLKIRKSVKKEEGMAKEIKTKKLNLILHGGKELKCYGKIIKMLLEM